MSAIVIAVLMQFVLTGGTFSGGAWGSATGAPDPPLVAADFCAAVEADSGYSDEGWECRIDADGNVEMFQLVEPARETPE